MNDMVNNAALYTNFSATKSYYANNAAKTDKINNTGAVNTAVSPAAKPDTAKAAEKDMIITNSSSTKYKPDLEKIESLYSEQKTYLKALQSITNQVRYQTSGVSLLNSLPQVGMNNAQSKSKDGKDNLFNLAGMSKIDGLSDMQDYFSLFVRNKDGSFSVDLSGVSPEARDKLIAKAKEDVSEDGYFGVKQTSERIVNFAKAITGGDPEKMEKMQKVVEKAFKQVGDIFGGANNLPDISKKTYDAIMKGFADFAAAQNPLSA
jgi:ABC-type Na+ efflux pump permease subunit